MSRVLVLDGGTRAALAVTRSLGAKGVHVMVGEADARSLAGASRFCAARLKYPSPFLDPEGFVDWVADACRRHAISTLYPISDITTYHILGRTELFPDTKVPCAPLETYEALTDKWTLFELAQELGLSTPDTVFVRGAADLPRHRRVVRFPTVIKPHRSFLSSNGRWVKASVQYADSWAELESKVTREESFARHPFLLQSYVRGGWRQAAVALYDRGKPVAFFCHRRIRDKPPSGQVGTFAESLVHEPSRELAERLLTHVGWHGVAMVELKVTPDGMPHLLEVNARFWAMLQLAIDAGVDFPWLLHQLATGRTPDPVRGYETGVRLRWLWGDIAHLGMLLLRRQLARFEPASEHWRAMSGFFHFFDSRTHYEINRWGDLAPAFHEIAHFLRVKIFRKASG